MINKVKVLFVCLGNICRSPMAEAVFQSLLDEAGLTDKFEIDSAGTGAWHVGEKAHPGTRQVLAKHGISYRGHARLVRDADVADRHTYVVAMDQSNVDSLHKMFGDLPQLSRLLEFAGQNDVRDVPDPYYNGNFEYVYQLVEDGCRGLLDAIREREGF